MQTVSKRGKGRRNKIFFNKGRQVDIKSLEEANLLLSKYMPLTKDMLIEYLHLFNDKYSGLYARHLRALAELTKLSMAEVYEVASFYAHFKIIESDDAKVSEISIKVCDSVTCFMYKSDNLLASLKKKYPGTRIEMLHAWEGVILLPS